MPHPCPRVRLQTRRQALHFEKNETSTNLSVDIVVYRTFLQSEIAKLSVGQIFLFPLRVITTCCHKAANRLYTRAYSLSTGIKDLAMRMLNNTYPHALMRLQLCPLAAGF
jgi:hypothetical protein